MKWRDQWDLEQDAKISLETGLDFTGTTTIVDQEAREDQDINVIMKRFGVKDGSAPLPQWEAANGIYGDISEFPQDPTAIANIFLDAKTRFNALPAAVRQRYPSPEALFEFLSDKNNKEEARKLGLLKTPPEVTPQPDEAPPEAPKA